MTDSSITNSHAMPSMAMIRTVECSVADARAIRKAVEIKASGILDMLTGIRLKENVKMRPGFAIGLDANDKAIGWLDSRGWHFKPIPDWMREVFNVKT